jgi:hypothetical protein
LPTYSTVVVKDVQELNVFAGPSVADSDLGLEPDPRIQILKIDHQNKDLPSKQK